MRALVILLAAALALFACADDTTGPDGSLRFTTSFENGHDGFAGDGADLDDPPVEWSIERTDELADEGEWAIRLELENLNDAGKIWIERSFALEPGRAYDVDLSFAFGTADFGDVNNWTIVAGASQDDPETADDLTFRGTTMHDQGQGAGVVWLEKEYAFTATASAGGTLWIAIGVWGTSEFTRAYLVDDVEVVLTPL